MSADYLLVIGIPDERSLSPQLDHIHAYGSQTEMEVLKRQLEDRFGQRRVHRLVEGRICPRCDITKGRRRE